jgi:predicted dehydrogenase
MGRHHVRCVRAARGLELAAMMDRDPEKLRDLPEGVCATTDLKEFLERCDAVVLCAPSDQHEDLGLACMAERKHVLVEKPLAPTLAACRRLEEEAARAGVVLGVGHVERMNAAVLAVEGLAKSVRFFEADRIAAFDPRGTEVDVILDLMIHDLDLILHWTGEDPERVDAVGVAVASERIDIASARLEFRQGAVANLTASRVSRTPARKLRLFQKDLYCSLDLGTQSAEIIRKSTEIISKDETKLPFAVSVEKKEAPPEHNPLVRELEEFAAAVRGEASQIVSAAQASRAVGVAQEITRQIESRVALWGETKAAASWGARSSS